MSLHSSTEFDEYYTPKDKANVRKSKKKRTKGMSDEIRRRRKQSDQNQQNIVKKNMEDNIDRDESEKKQKIPNNENKSTEKKEVDVDVCTRTGRGCCVCCATAFCVCCGWCGTWCESIQTIKEWEKGVVFQFKKVFKKVLNPGLVVINPLIQSVRRVDMRERVLSVPPQRVITKDLVTVEVDAVIYYKIKEGKEDKTGEEYVYKSITQIEDIPHSTTNIAKGELRKMIGSRRLEDVLAGYETLSAELKKNIDKPTDPWGVEITKVEILDIRVPANLRRDLAVLVETEQEMKGLKKQAEGEQKAANKLAIAASTLNEAKGAFTLRYLQICRDIATEGRSRLYYGVPLQMGELPKK